MSGFRGTLGPELGGCGVVFWFTVAAFGGYGDAGQGYPTIRGRQMTAWVNAVRADPSAFQAEYQAGGCSYAQFSAAEKTAKEGYRWNDGLARVALEHSVDMETNAWFAHDSSDGTVWSDRVWSAYPGGAIAENIAFGYDSAKWTVTRIWMCSSAGHRGALTSSVYDDFGGDMAGTYATADMGDDSTPLVRSLRIGAHEPESPTTTVTFLADWKNASAPTSFVVVHDGVAHDLALAYGSSTQGVWTAALPVDGGTCFPYFFEARVGATVERFPATGSYSFGSCAGAGAETGWIPAQVGPIDHSQSSASWRVGDRVTFVIDGAVPGETVGLVAGTGAGAGPCLPQLGGSCLDIVANHQLVGTAVADAGGTATLVVTVPQVPSGLTVQHQPVVSDGQGNWSVGPRLQAIVQ